MASKKRTLKTPVGAAAKPAFTRRELLDFERKLLELRAALARTVGSIERDALGPSGETTGPPADESIEEAALDVELETLATEDQLGYEVAEALGRLASGHFSLCEECGRAIARERLVFLPWARECRDCRSASETRAR